MSTTTIRVVARLNVRPGKLEATLTAFDDLVTGSRSETGCITYEALQNIEDPHEFTFVEEWESAEALEEHFVTEHFQAMKALGDELFTAPPDIRRYTLAK